MGHQRDVMGHQQDVMGHQQQHKGLRWEREGRQPRSLFKCQSQRRSIGDLITASVFLSEDHASSPRSHHYCTDNEQVRQSRGNGTGRGNLVMGSKPGEHGEITKDTTGCYISVMQHPLERRQSRGRGDRTTDVLPQGQRRGGRQLHAQTARQCLRVWLF